MRIAQMHQSKEEKNKSSGKWGKLLREHSSINTGPVVSIVHRFSRTNYSKMQ